jgi:hypothetical protein
MLAERAQYGVSITPRSGGDRSVGKLIPVHNPQMRAPDISTTQAVARKAAETPSLGGRKLAEALPWRARRVSEALSYRIAWAEGWCRQVDEEPLASIAKPNPRLMTRVSNSTDVSGFHQISKNKVALIDAVLQEPRHARLDF